MLASEGLTLLGLAAALLGAGLLAGFLGGMIGAGGGLIVIPVLYQVFAGLGVDPAVRMHLVVGTALATVIPMSLLGMRAHWKRGNINVAVLRELSIPIVVGALLAGAAAGSVPGRLLSLLFALVAVMMSINMSLGKAVMFREGVPGPVGTRAIGVAIGSLSTLVGIGGATLSVPVLHALRLPMPLAVGTASAFGALIGLPGAISFALGGLGDTRLPPGSIGYVNWIAVATMFPASALAVSWGARLTPLVNERLLRALFACFLLVSAMRMLLAQS